MNRALEERRKNRRIGDHIPVRARAEAGGYRRDTCGCLLDLLARRTTSPAWASILRQDKPHSREYRKEA